MDKKRTKILFIILAAVLIVAMLAMVACTGAGGDEPEPEDPDDGKPTINKPQNFNQYMAKINLGLTTGGAELDELTDYHVSAEYTLATSTQNYTVTYEAVYKKNAQDNLLYLRVFDNDNHIERIRMYYDGRNLYAISGQKYYKADDFGGLLLYETLKGATEYLDLKYLFYGDEVKKYFDEGSVLSNVFNIGDCSYQKTVDGESVMLQNGDLDILVGTLNAAILNVTEGIGTTFDVPSLYYLGFKASKFTQYQMNTLNVNTVKFTLKDSKIVGTQYNIGGRMQDNSKYFADLKYNYDTETKVIAAAADMKEKDYDALELGKGSYEGKVKFPNVRESDFDVALDYDLNSEDNSKNEFTLRIYDQKETYTGKFDKYANIEEFLGIYYSDEVLYINLQGVYGYLGGGVDLDAIRMRKIYVKNIDLSSLIKTGYSELIRIAKLILDGDFRTENKGNSKAYEAIVAATTSDVDKMEITVEVTEDLIKTIRNDETSVSVLLSRLLGLGDKVVGEVVGEDFFQMLKAVFRYGFKTKVFGTDLYYGDDKIMESNFKRVDYEGVTKPHDLDDINYTEMRTPEVVTVEYVVSVRPYNTETIDLSAFIGAFVGDVSAQNLKLTVGLGEELYLKGKVSEYTIKNADGTTRNVNSVDLKFYKRASGTSETSEQNLVLSVATNPVDVDEFMVSLYLDIGDYENTNGIFYRLPTEAVNKGMDTLAGGKSVFTESGSIETFLRLYKESADNIKTYRENGYYCINVFTSETNDPVGKMLGVRDTFVVAKMKMGFEKLDLSGLNASKYVDPQIERIEQVTIGNVYENGSKWIDEVDVYLDGIGAIKMRPSYEKDSIEIKSGKSDYMPRASLFGKEFEYAVHIREEKGSYLIKELDIEDNLYIIDPCYYSAIPEKIAVRYDNDDTGEVPFVIAGFYDANVSRSGYNLPLFGGEFKDEYAYVVKVGGNSICEAEFKVYVAVHNREVQPVVDKNGQKRYYVDPSTGTAMPVVGELNVDPYTYAMKKRVDEKYDFIDEGLTGVRLNFNNVYGKESVQDELTKEWYLKDLTYEKEGYNYLIFDKLDLKWQFNGKITFRGGEMYATAVYGDADNGDALYLAVRINVKAKVVESVIIDGKDGSYTIDYLDYSTYSIPVNTTQAHTVKVKFKDGTERTVTTMSSSSYDLETYCSQYVYGSLQWEGTDGLEEKIRKNRSGITAIFGDGNVTTAVFGKDICDDAQTVSLRVIVPSRELKSGPSVTLVPGFDDEGNMRNPATRTLSMAKFRLSDDDCAPYSINPYDGTARMPSSIYLSVATTTGSSPLYAWQEYPVQWLTTDKDGNETNVLRELDDGTFVLKNPVTEETQFAVYGIVGDEQANVTVTMRVMNLASYIKSQTLYNNGEEVDITQSIKLDPFLEYIDRLPNAFEAVLGSGERVTDDGDGIAWFVKVPGQETPFPIRRADSAAFADGSYDIYYNDLGRYVFPKEGGTYDLVMYVEGGNRAEDTVSGKIINEIIIGVTVEKREKRTYTEKQGATTVAVSDFADVFAEEREKDTAYTIKDGAEHGYFDIDAYDETSYVLYQRLLSIYNNDGYGVIGFVFTADETLLYAKQARLNRSELSVVLDALRTPSAHPEAVIKVTGVIDEDNINVQTVMIAFALNKQEPVSVTLTNANALVEGEILSVRNDENGDGTLSLAGEMNKVSYVDYNENERYNAFYKVTEGYSEDDFDYVIYFDVAESYNLSTGINKLYVSPYEYFKYVFEGLDIVFESGAKKKNSAVISLNGVSEEYFNKSVLGLVPETVVTDAESSYAYSFLILSRITQGSATDRVIVIIKSECAKGQTTQSSIVIEPFNGELTESYTNGYEMPGVIEVEYLTARGKRYTVRYPVAEWDVERSTASELGVTKIKKIEANKIDVFTGATYQFIYMLPDVEEEFNLILNIPKKYLGDETNGFNYDATGYISMYDVKNGVITIDNPYMFLTRNDDGKYVYDVSKIPTVIEAKTTGGRFTQTNVNSFEINWKFVKTEFDESVFVNGTVDAAGDPTAVTIAEYSFNSYYRGRERSEQKLLLKVKINKLVFYGISAPGVTVNPSTDGESNAKYDTIVIDPYAYGDNGYSNSFVLPTNITLSFNMGTQTYDFTSARYFVLSSDGENEIREIVEVGYTETGHKLWQSIASITDKNNLLFNLYVDGFSETGIKIKMTFIQRLINEVRIENYFYNDEGEYEYVKGENGELVKTEKEGPIRKSYLPQAKYIFTDDSASVAGLMPIWYVDPYNSATFALPEKAFIDFNSDKGNFREYVISGWQYYDEESARYVDVEEVASVSGAAKKKFYAYAGKHYFNPGDDSYGGGRFIVRGYISVGTSQQFFEVLIIALNRSLRTGLVLGSGYKVSYDFSDPVSAMLADIPSILGEQMFVDYDSYNTGFAVDNAMYALRKGRYSFAIEKASRYAQENENGEKTNKAVVPALLWEDEYDTDGDGVADITFEEFTTKGYNGEIDGNVYYKSGLIGALDAFIKDEVEGEYSRLIKSVVWESFFDENGEVIAFFSQGARRTIEAAQEKLFKDVIFNAYDMALNALNVELRTYLRDDLLKATLSEVNQESVTSGKIYDLSNEDDKKEIVYRLYEDLLNEYEIWKNEGALVSERTGKTDIVEAWINARDEFTNTNAVNTGNVSVYQILKAKYYDSISFFEEEENRNKRLYDRTAAALKNYIRADVWKRIVEKVSVFEKDYLDKIAQGSTVTGNETLSLAYAYEKLINTYEDNDDIGSKGEKATAEISVPRMEYSRIVDASGGNVGTIQFSKFNFAGVETEFTVEFNLYYKKIFTEEIDKAKSDAESDYRDDKAEESLKKYKEELLRKALDGIAPTQYNETTGKYDIIDGFRISSGAGSVYFGYDYYKSQADGGKASYAKLYKALYEYRANTALFYMISNINSLKSYDKIDDITGVTAPEWSELLKMLKFATGYVDEGEEYVKYAEAVYKKAAETESNSSRKDEAAKELARYILENHPELKKLAAYKAKASYEAYATMANGLLSPNSSSAKGKAMERMAESAGYPSDSKAASGAGIFFSMAYGSIGGTRFNLAEAMYEMLAYYFKDADGRFTDTVFETIYNAEQSYPRYKNGVVSLKAYISSAPDVKKAATTLYEFLLGYVASDVTPYKTLCDNGTKLGDYYTKEYIDGILNFVKIEDKMLETLNFACDNGYIKRYAKAEVVKRFKQYLVYKAIETQCLKVDADKQRINAWYNESLKAVRNACVTSLMQQLKDNFTEAYDLLITDSTLSNVESDAFGCIVDERVAAANAFEAEYLDSVNDYYGKNLYKGSKAILDALTAAKLRYGNNTESLVSSGYIYSKIYGPFLPDSADALTGHKTMYDSTDDYRRDAASQERLNAYLTSEATKLGLVAAYNVDAADVVRCYLKDMLLRTIVYYYDNVAEVSQKLVIAEVLGMYTGKKYNAENIDGFDAQKEILLYAVNNGLTAFGNTLMEDLAERKDLGLDYASDVENCYYYVYLNYMLDGMTYYVSTVEVTKDSAFNNALTNYKETFGDDTTFGDVSAEDAILSYLEKMADGKTRNTVSSAMLATRGGYNDERANAEERMKNEAYKYVYYALYDTKNESGEYEYKADFDDILGEMVKNGVLDAEEYYQRVFEYVQERMLDEKLNVVAEAVKKAVIAVVYGKLYDDVAIFEYTQESFASAFVKYLTGGEGGAEDLFGPDKDATGGIIGDYVYAVRNGVTNETVTLYGERIANWTQDFIGNASDSSKAILNAIYLQAYYQNAGGASTRKAVAYAQAVYNAYLFLGDLEAYVYENMPSDYAFDMNVAEKKAYYVKTLINENVMENPGHSLSLAKATLASLVIDYMKKQAELVAAACGGSAGVSDGALEDAYVDAITICLMRKTVVTKDDALKALYGEYLAKAKQYVGYTSASGSNLYDADADNPVFAYVNRIYEAITGYAIGASAATKVNEADKFGELGLNYYLEQAAGNYELALTLMTVARIVYGTFYSEDYVSNNEDVERHRMFFDRSEWENATGDVQVSLANSKVYFVNGKKVSREDINLKNSFRAEDITFALTDITQLDLVFEPFDINDKDNRNTLEIDAVAPALPSKAKAFGYIFDQNGVSVTGEDGVYIGEVEIASYSDSMRNLVYTEQTVSGAAYYVKVNAVNGNQFVVGVKVKYKNRQVERMYTSYSQYSQDGVMIYDKNSLFANMYEMFSADRNKNVLYLDPTNTQVLNASGTDFILPSTLGIEYGDGTGGIFTNVVWEADDLKYSISGTSGKDLPIKIKFYEFTSDEGNLCSVTYDYKNYKVTLKVYLGEEGSLLRSEEYALTKDTMLDWNAVVYAEDRTIVGIEYYTGSEYVTLGAFNEKIGRIDATDSGYEINPYNPVYPSRLRLSFRTGNRQIIDLDENEWSLMQTNALENICKDYGSLKEGETQLGEDEKRTFGVYFKYLGYNINVLFKEMGIRLSKVYEPTESGEIALSMIEGGDLFVITNQSSIDAQLKANYSKMYYNFGSSANPNWQEIPVTFSPVQKGVKEEGTYEVQGVLGMTRLGVIDNNVTFTVHVVDVKLYGKIGYEDNLFVVDDYVSAPKDNSNNKRTSADEPNTSGNEYLHVSTYTDSDGVKRTEKTVFSVDRERTEYDFVASRAVLTLGYGSSANVDQRLGFGKSGDRTRTVKYNAALKGYVYSNVKKPVFDTDETGKKWKWTKLSKADPQYTDEIYWELGRPLLTSDLPEAIDGDSGERIALKWDISNLNVNEANEYGYVIYGYYMNANSAWESLPLKVTIGKIDVGNTVIDAVNGDDGRYMFKTYDAKFFKLGFDASAMTFLRKDGSYASLAEGAVKIYYADAEEMTWSETDYPINAGKYFVKVVFDDYNVYSADEEEKWFVLTIKPFEIEPTNLYFNGEKDSDGNVKARLEYVYDGTPKELYIAEGLPETEVDNWFEPGEKEELVESFVRRGNTVYEAKTLAYAVIYERVNAFVKETMEKWYAETRAAYPDYTREQVTSMVYDNKMVYNLRIVEVKVGVEYTRSGIAVSAPIDVGDDYLATAYIDSPEGNYVFTSDKNGVRKKSIGISITRKESRYNFVKTTLEYNGLSQNPMIDGLHVNGVIPADVKITYRYEFGNNVLVVVNEGNNISVVKDLTTPGITTRGIKDVRDGGYVCTATIEESKNFVGGECSATIRITPADLFVTVDEVSGKYLGEVEEPDKYVRIYTGDKQNGASDGYLCGDDRLKDLGYFLAETNVQSFYPVGQYYTYIRGLKLDSSAEHIYTEYGAEYTAGASCEYKELRGMTFVKLKLKSATGSDAAGSLYSYVDNDKNYIYQDRITLFGNYNVYVRMDNFTDMSGGSAQTVKASGIYRIEAEKGSIGFDNDVAFSQYIAGLKDNDSAIIYLEPLTNGAYSAITVKADAILTIVGYYNEAGEISTFIKGITMEKGVLTLKVIGIDVDTNGGNAFYVGEKAGAINVVDCQIRSTKKAVSTVGINVQNNYKETVNVSGTKFSGLSVGVELSSGSLRVENSEFKANYIGVNIYESSSRYTVSIESNVFDQHGEVAVRSSKSNVTVRYNTFTNNTLCIMVPEITDPDMNVSNVFDRTNVENIVEKNVE